MPVILAVSIENLPFISMLFFRLIIFGIAGENVMPTIRSLVEHVIFFNDKIIKVV